MTKEQKEKLLNLVQEKADSFPARDAEERSEWNDIYWNIVIIETEK